MKTCLITLAVILLGIAAQAQILKPVQWKYAARKLSPTEVLVSVTANIDKGWHIYGLTVPKDGPVQTSLVFDPSQAYFPLGEIMGPKPLSHFEETFNMHVPYFEKVVTFQQRFKISQKTTTIKGNIEFMVCSKVQCLPPETIDFEIPLK
jgi:DsbC/DsbD-like thiol-disulfide interchange protein